MTFNQFNLDTRINSAVEYLGYTEPTPIQEQAIPVVLEGKDVLGVAQTGTGKTAAFMLPILHALTTSSGRKTRALVLAPTRELAEQIHQETKKFAHNLKIKSVAIYGGVGKGPQISALKRGTEIVIACPGRLLDLMSDGLVDLSGIEFFVLDEADRMCDMGFIPDVRKIIKQLPAQRQTLFFSATMPKDARALADTILRNPVTVQIGMIAPAKTVSHALFPITQKRKKDLLLEILENTATGKVLLFTRTKYRARNLARDLGKKGYRVAALQGNMSQNQRQQAIDGFRGRRYDLLVATDIAARGIDVSDITHVINIDIPDTVDAYTHRIGRTGRAEESGEAFTFITPEDTAMVRDLERMLKYSIDRRVIEDFDYGDLDPENMPERAAPKKKYNNAGNGQRNGNSYRGGGNRNGGRKSYGGNNRNANSGPNKNRGGAKSRNAQRQRTTAK